MKELIKVDRNGTKYWRQEVTCDRCGGHGYYAIAVCNGQPVLSPHDHGMCWKCEGRGKVIETVKEYTPEHAAKLEARRAAKLAKQQAEHAAMIAKAAAEAEARRQQEIAERLRRAGKFIGEVGQKIEAEVTLEYTTHFQTLFGTNTVYAMKDGEGNTLVWITGGTLQDKDGNVVIEGDRFTVKGTIKEHKEYRDVNQTVLQRVKAENIVAQA